MGVPKASYIELCKEACVQLGIVNRNKVDELSLEEMETVIKNQKHSPEFYFWCGTTFGIVGSDIFENGCTDEINALCEGIALFENLIGIEDD